MSLPLRISAFVIGLAALAGCSLLPSRKSPATPRVSTGTTRPPIQRPEDQRCLANLGSTGARYSALADKYDAPGCQALGSVRIDRLPGDSGSFTATNLGPVACPLAGAFAGWARFGVDRAARQLLGSGLARIETMGSYSCRNVAGTSRLSAHSRAEAIDVGAFVLADRRRIAVKSGWNGASEQERAFLRTVHASACKRFGTVLGPDYNAAHADHLHVELGQGSFCR
jgi:hypothetical protein